jgi:hypothetical protein
MMKEEWLPAGEFNHIWYPLHLVGWVVLVSCLTIPLLMIVKVGGVPLMVSMFELKYRVEDSPSTWLEKIRSLLRRSKV